MSQPVILASSSSARQTLLNNAGICFTTARPLLDEESARAGMRAAGLLPRDQAMALAEMKAVKISLSKAGLVIGADQMLSIEQQALDKPKDITEAETHLRLLSGKPHYLETALCIAENGQVIWRHLSRPKLTMRVLSDSFLQTYIESETENLLTSVGGYKLEGPGIQLFNEIDGDYFSILGLPLLPLLDYLRTRGVIET